MQLKKYCCTLFLELALHDCKLWYCFSIIPINVCITIRDEIITIVFYGYTFFKTSLLTNLTHGNDSHLFFKLSRPYDNFSWLISYYYNWYILYWFPVIRRVVSPTLPQPARPQLQGASRYIPEKKLFILVTYM